MNVPDTLVEFISLFPKVGHLLGLVVQVFNRRTLKAEAGESL